jgi:hypothetical protein
MYKFEFELYMLYLYGEKVCIGDLKKLCRKSLNRTVPANRKSAKSHLRKVRKSNKLFNSANSRIMICGTYLRTTYHWYMYKQTLLSWSL